MNDIRRYINLVEARLPPRKLPELEFWPVNTKRDLVGMLKRLGWVRLAIQGDKMVGWDAGDYTHGDYEQQYGNCINLNVAEEKVGMIVVEFSAGGHGATSPAQLRAMPVFSRVFKTLPVTFRDHDSWEDVPE